MASSPKEAICTAETENPGTSSEIADVSSMTCEPEIFSKEARCSGSSRGKPDLRQRCLHLTSHDKKLDMLGIGSQFDEK
ncbi:hypothetical protein DL766_002290 [Monosporascus sp. MC13-8B]|uniref:Uncharacterized protein n=1 Tax=Monosporascus cannonballus TaxID=155416 RepID=A0ABY0H313_9PEZI|nr:hypothetical protein DL762_006411 [Monosporascus cannonballus]RYO86482.1 hypothetical protein DL763_006674 [Monosporascus cannonballus]RYP35889.1 hypothetical protein DL766_002290 [Monosporascus sp. MC13-8B]